MQPHGQFEMERRGQMMICRPSGPFNLAGAAAYEAHFARELTGLAAHPWGIVEVATEFEAAGPEVLIRFRRQFGWCAENGCLFLAVVLSGGFKRYLPIKSSKACRFGRCAISSRRGPPFAGWNSSYRSAK